MPIGFVRSKGRAIVYLSRKERPASYAKRLVRYPYDHSRRRCEPLPSSSRKELGIAKLEKRVRQLVRASVPSLKLTQWQDSPDYSVHKL